MKFKRNLEKQLVTLFAISISLLMLIEGGLTYSFINNEVRNWQLTQVDKSHFIIQNLIDSRLDELEVLAKDYAYWDVTYDAVHSYETSTLKTFVMSEEDLPTSNLLGVLLSTDQGEQVSVATTLNPYQQTLLIDEFFDINMNEDFSGVIFLQDRIVMYVKKQVKRGTNGQFANGFLVLFRELLTTDIRNISQSVGTLFTLEVTNDSAEAKGFVLNENISEQQIMLSENNKRLVATYEYTLENGERLPVHSKIYLEKQLTSLMKVDSLILYILMTVLVIALLMLIIIRKIVVNPIISLSKHVAKFDIDGGDYEATTIPNKSEIGRLAHNINKSFESAVSQHKFNKVLLDSIDDVVITIDSALRIKYANPAALKWLNLSKENLNEVNLNFALTLITESGNSLIKRVNESFLSGLPFKDASNVRNNLKQGAVYQAEISGYKIQEVERQSQLMLLIVSLDN